MSETKNYFFITVVVALILVVFSVFVGAFDLSQYNVYLTVNSGFVIASLIAFIVLSVGEFLSLGFDRTATKNTFFMALLLLGFHVFSHDFVVFLYRLGVPNNDVLSFIEQYIIPHLNHLCFVFFVYFSLCFFEKDFQAPKVSNISLLALSIFMLADILVNSLRLEVVSMIFSILESLFVIFMAMMTLYHIRKKENFITAYFSCSIVCFVTIAYLTNLLGLLSFIPYFLSVPSLALLFSAAFFVMIYVHFFVNKTKRVYELEDDALRKKKIDVKLKVTCFKTFDCFLDEELLEFPAKKSKELFALLVALNGKSLSMDKAITFLWPDKDVDKAKVSYRDIIWKLRKFFESINFKGVEFKRGLIILKREYIECDFYDLLKSDGEIDMEEFMPEYDWSLNFEIN